MHISTLKREKDVIWATSPCSGGRWSLPPGGDRGAQALRTFTLSSYSSVSGEKAPNLPVRTLSPYPRGCVISRAHAPRQLKAGRMASVCNCSTASPHARLCFHSHRRGRAGRRSVLRLGRSPAGCWGGGWGGRAVSVSQVGSEPPPRPPLDSGRDLGSTTTPCTSLRSFSPPNISWG